MNRESKHIGKVSISIVCVILGVLLSLQLKSVRENAVADDWNGNRMQTLQTLLDEERETNARQAERIDELEDEVQMYRQAAASGGREETLLDEIARLEKLAGLTDVVGPGVEVVLNDSTAPGSDHYLIHDSDLLSVVNELRDAGAEAISINGNRVLATTEIRCSGSVVTINGKRTSAPFVIDAIGDQETMFNALMMRNGVVDVLRQWSIEVEVTPVDELLIQGYRGKIEYEYAQTRTADNVTDDETEAG